MALLLNKDTRPRESLWMGDGAQTFATARLIYHPNNYSEQPKHILWMLCVHVPMREREQAGLFSVAYNEHSCSFLKTS